MNVLLWISQLFETRRLIRLKSKENQLLTRKIILYLYTKSKEINDNIFFKYINIYKYYK